MKSSLAKRAVIIGSSGLLLAIGVLLLLGFPAHPKDRPIQIRLTRFQKDDAGLRVAMFEFSNSSPYALNIRVPGADLDGRGRLGMLSFNIDGGTRTDVLVPVPTNNSPWRIRASYLSNPALFQRWKVIAWLDNKRFRFRKYDFVFAPTVVGPAVEPLPNL